VIIFGNRAHYSGIGGVENSIRSMLKIASERNAKALMVCREPIANEALDAAAMDFPEGVELVTYADEYQQNPLRRLLFLHQGGLSLTHVYRGLVATHPSASVVVRHHMHVLAAHTAGYRDIRYLVPSLTVNQLREDLVGSKGLRRLKIITHMVIDGWLQDRAFRKAGLFVFSESMQRQVRKRLPKAEKDTNITMVVPGIDNARFRPISSYEKIKLRRRLGLPINQDLFLFVGRFAQCKGLTYLLEAFAGMPINCQLALVGEGEGESTLRDTVSALGLKKRVLFLGTTSTPEDYYRACDSFVMSSTYEPLGQTIIEAAACGMRLSAFSREAGVDTATQELGLCDVIHYANELTAGSLRLAMMQSLPPSSKLRLDRPEEPVRRVYSWAALLDNLIK